MPCLNCQTSPPLLIRNELESLNRSLDQAIPIKLAGQKFTHCHLEYPFLLLIDQKVDGIAKRQP